MRGMVNNDTHLSKKTHTSATHHRHLCAISTLFRRQRGPAQCASLFPSATHGPMVMARFRDCPDVMLSEALHWSRVVSLGIRTHFVSFGDESLPLIILELNGEVISQSVGPAARAPGTNQRHQIRRPCDHD